MTRLRTGGPVGAARQGGAAAIEFALVFPLFLLLFFGMVFFGISLTLQHNLTHAAQTAARAGLAVDPEEFPTPAAFEAKVKEQVKAEVDLALASMPAGITVNSTVTSESDVYWVNVTVTLPKDKHPLSTLAGFLSLDELTDLTGRARLRL